MSKYSPPSDDESGDESDDKKPKAKRAKKDPNAPKQPMVRVFDEKNLITKLLNRIAKPLFLFSTQNAYLLYANSVRGAVRKENPDLSMGDLVSYGCMLESMSHSCISSYSPHDDCFRPRRLETDTSR